MSFKDCMNKAVQAKQVSRQKANEALERYDIIVERNVENGMSQDAAETAAAQFLGERIEADKQAKLKTTLRTIQAKRRLADDLEGYKNAKGETDLMNAALALFERDQLSGFTSVEGRKNVVRGQAHALMANVLEKFGPQKSGLVRPKAGMNDMVRELFGSSTGSKSAKEMADAVSETFEMLRQRANRAGANIAKHDNYGMPQTHDRVLVAKAGRENWVASISDKLDWDKMRDPETGLTVPVEERLKTLDTVYNTIKTDGYVKLKAGDRAGQSMAKRLANHRFLEFKDGDAWLAYHEEFGVGSPFDVMISHIERMARDISVMEVFGPNPYVGKEYAKSLVKSWAGKADAEDGGAAKKLLTQSIDKKLGLFDELYATVTNSNAGFDGDRWGNSFAGIRNILTSAFLGSASLLAVPGDMFTKAMTRQFNKLPGTVDMRRYFKMMNPADNSDRNLAVRSGLIAESATSIAYGQTRFLGQITGPQLTQRISDVVLRASLLTPHTQAAKWAFGMEFMGALADNVKTPFDKLPYKKTLERYGIDAKDWDIYRQTPLYEHKGASFLRPDDLRVREDLDEGVSQDIADKIMEMIQVETDFAVPSAALRSRAFLVSDSRPGTLVGELARSMAMFKNFPVTIMFTHMRRGLLQKSTAGKLSYLAAFGIGMTTMGALGLQMRQVADGKDPLNMNPITPEGQKFWGNAALAGGGLGIWGDFLFNDVNRYGGGLATNASGPVVGAIADTTKITAGNLLQLAEGEETDFAPELIKYVQRYMPGSNLWYLKLALKREVFDQLLLEVDPDAAKKIRKLERKALREHNQEYFWSPGDSVLRGDNIRPPDASAAFQD